MILSLFVLLEGQCSFVDELWDTGSAVREKEKKG